MRQPHPLLVNYSNLFSALTYMEKSLTINTPDAWNKPKTYFGDTIIKNLTPNEIKTILGKRMIDSY